VSRTGVVPLSLLEAFATAPIFVQDRWRLPDQYQAYHRRWFALGWPASIVVMIIFYLMVAKPRFERRRGQHAQTVRAARCGRPRSGYRRSLSISACIRALYSSDQRAPGFDLTVLLGGVTGAGFVSRGDFRAPIFSLRVARGES
jgi:Predicted integral membrane protein (DUF2269)